MNQPVKTNLFLKKRKASGKEHFRFKIIRPSQYEKIFSSIGFYVKLNLFNWAVVITREPD
jgi:hypothetical protein